MWKNGANTSNVAPRRFLVFSLTQWEFIVLNNVHLINKLHLLIFTTVVMWIILHHFLGTFVSFPGYQVMCNFHLRMAKVASEAFATGAAIGREEGWGHQWSPWVEGVAAETPTAQGWPQVIILSWSGWSQCRCYRRSCRRRWGPAVLSLLQPEAGQLVAAKQLT